MQWQRNRSSELGNQFLYRCSKLMRIDAGFIESYQVPLSLDKPSQGRVKFQVMLVGNEP